MGDRRDDDHESAGELRRAAVMFPRFFLWFIGILLGLLTLLGSAVVTNVYTSAEEAKRKVEKHEGRINEHESRVRLLEQAIKNTDGKLTETGQDVKEIRRLLEQQLRRDGKKSGT